MNIEKLPSGSYRIRETHKGIRYSLTVPYKPTKKEAWDLLQEKMHRKVKDIVFENAYKEYIRIKENVLSPSTIRGYNTIFRNMDKWFLEMDIGDIEEYHLQKLISDYAEKHSPKSTRNLYGLVRAVIRFFIPQSSISATLPQKVHRESHAPTREDIQRLLETADGTPYYIPIYLATLSLRRSEICALTLDDLSEDNKLTINKALVPCDDGYTLKPTPKTDASNRVILLPDHLAERIRAQGYIFKYQPQAIDQYIRRTLPKLGIKQFSVHKLRHFFASYAHDLGYTDAQIQKMGGWSTDNVMKTVYRHAMNGDEASKQIATDFTF